MKCLKKGRSTLCSAGICSRCSCYWLFGDMLQAQYLKSDKEAKTANSHCTLASFQQFSGLLRQKNGDIATLSLQFSLKCSIFLLLLLKKSRAHLVDFARAVRLPLRSVRTTSTYPYHAAQSVFQAHDWLGSVLFLLSLAYCAVCQNINERL